MTENIPSSTNDAATIPLEHGRRAGRVSSKALWAGRIISALPVLMLLFSAVMKLMKVPAVMKGFAELGYQPNVIFGIAILEITCAVIYIIPGTAVLGAILVTGYLGGATATHVRVGQPFYGPVLLGVLAWVGLLLRERRLRPLLPLRSKN